MHNIDKERAQHISETICESRYFQEKLKENKFGGYFDVGEEAITVGALAAVNNDDIVSTYFRGESTPIRYRGGVSLNDQMAWWTGRIGASNPDTNVLPSLWTDVEKGVLGPASSCLGGDVDLCCGAALAQKLQKTGRIVVLFVGDGATAKGNFHETLTFAAIHKLPLVVVVRNNGWAMSTPTEQSIAVTDVSKMAGSYDMPAVITDGNDALAVYDEVKKAAEFARSGKGPYMIEAKTYRMSAHSANDEDDYRSVDVMNEWKAKDPIIKMGKHLLEYGFSEADITECKKNTEQAVSNAYEYAMTLPKLSIENVRQSHIDTVNRMWGRP